MFFATTDTLNWDVLSRDLSYQVDGNTYYVPNKKALVRDDDSRVIGIVGNKYEVFQNSSLKDLIYPMVEEGLLTIENMGYLGDGQKVFIQAGMAEEYTIAGEPFKGMITLMNSHDGTTKMSAGVTTTRIWCSNTFAMAMGNMETKLRHTLDIHDKALAITEVTEFVNERMSRYGQHVATLKGTKCDLLTLDNFITDVYQSENVKGRNAIKKFFRVGQGNNGENLFDAVNAVTEYTTHQAIGDGQRRFASVNFGRNADINRRAMNVALALV